MLEGYSGDGTGLMVGVDGGSGEEEEAEAKRG